MKVNVLFIPINWLVSNSLTELANVSSIVQRNPDSQNSTPTKRVRITFNNQSIVHELSQNWKT